MRVFNVVEHPTRVYTSNVYLLLGEWSTMSDVNTLVDVGNDPSVLDRILAAPTGVGKKVVAQVLFTHSHFDHTALLPQVREAFSPLVYAHSSFAGADAQLHDGQRIKCGDEWLEVIHTPGHSEDSICLYCENGGVLFSGDTPMAIRSADQTYDARFVEALTVLTQRNIRIIYPGHGPPITENVQALLKRSLEMVCQAATAV